MYLYTEIWERWGVIHEIEVAECGGHLYYDCFLLAVVRLPLSAPSGTFIDPSYYIYVITHKSSEKKNIFHFCNLKVDTALDDAVLDVEESE